MNLKCNTKEDCIKGMGLSSYSDQEMSQAENSMPGFSKYLDSIQCNEGLCHYKMSENQEPYFDVNNNGAVISCNTKSNCDVGNGMTQLYECVNGICKMHYNNMPIEAWRSVSQNTNLDANQMLPEKCSSNNPSINCIDSAKVNQNSIEIALRNNVGFSIKVDDIWANNCNGNKLMGIGSNTNYQSLGLTVSNNDIFRLLILGCDNTEEMYEGDMIIYYTNTETGLSHQANTEIRSYLN